jgi:hypothetical protein
LDETSFKNDGFAEESFVRLIANAIKIVPAIPEDETSLNWAEPGAITKAFEPCRPLVTEKFAVFEGSREKML